LPPENSTTAGALGTLPLARERAPRRRPVQASRHVTGWLLAAPLTLVLLAFLLGPMAMITVVSFWTATEFSIVPAFSFENYQFLLTSDVTWRVLLNTFRYAAITWAITLVLGFTVAYYLAFHIRTEAVRIALFLVCTIPFWTSNIIRMISWIPFLGREGIANSTLLSLGVIDQPLDWLLFSDFSVILAFVHLNTFFMVVPIFNTMMRLDRGLLEAASDAGASGWQTLWNVVIPLSRPGILIGSIFVVALVMGDFMTVRFMSGSQSANMGRLLQNDVGLLQYPSASATSVLLLVVTLMIIGVFLKLVDIRKEL